jgi:hypothetical protein
MPKTQRVFLSSLSRFPALAGGLAICVEMSAPVLAKAQGSKDLVEPARYWTSAERWAWSEIKEGEVADFNKHCGTPDLDPKDEKDRRWQDGCRELPARFLQDLLKRAPWREQVPSKGVWILGARILGDIDLENAKLIRAIQIYDSRIEGAISLRRAHMESLIFLAGSLLNGDFVADGLHAESDLFLVNGGSSKVEFICVAPRSRDK